MTREFEKRENESIEELTWRICLSNLQGLKDNHDEALRGGKCEWRRLELAHISIRAFWMIYKNYLRWIEDYLFGRYVMAQDSDLCRAIEEGLGELDPEEWEDLYISIGAYLTVHQFVEIDPRIEELFSNLIVDDDFDSLPSYNHVHIQQKVFQDILFSREDVGEVDFLFMAFRDLAKGSRSPIFDPPVRSKGNASALHDARNLALMHVAFLVGKGSTKLSAQLEVGEILGVSAATLRYWETLQFRDEIGSFYIHCAEFGGVFELELRAGHRDKLDKEYGTTFKGLDLISTSILVLDSLRRNPLEHVRELLNSAQRADK